jgi:hypothetical protein
MIVTYCHENWATRGKLRSTNNSRLMGFSSLLAATRRRHRRRGDRNKCFNDIKIEFSRTRIRKSVARPFEMPSTNTVTRVQKESMETDELYCTMRLNFEVSFRVGRDCSTPSKMGLNSRGIPRIPATPLFQVRAPDSPSEISETRTKT